MHAVNVAEHYGIYVSSTGGTNIDEWELVFSETLTSTAWQNRSIVLADFYDEELYIAFRHFNTTNQNMIRIDDIWFGEMLVTDPLFTIAPRAGLYEDVVVGDEITQLFTITNYGVQSLVIEDIVR
jgi:hypothetical protein